MTCPEAIHGTFYKAQSQSYPSDLFHPGPRKMIFKFLACVLPVYGSGVDIVDGEFRLNNEKIFLSGANQAWHWFGFDFGNGNWWKEPSRYKQ